jgi:hypothetical protein
MVTPFFNLKNLADSNHQTKEATHGIASLFWLIFKAICPFA